MCLTKVFIESSAFLLKKQADRRQQAVFAQSFRPLDCRGRPRCSTLALLQSILEALTHLGNDLWAIFMIVIQKSKSLGQ